MGEGYYGVSDEFIMYVVVPCVIGVVCLIFEWLGVKYVNQD